MNDAQLKRAASAVIVVTLAAWVVVPFLVAGPRWVQGWLYVGVLVPALVVQQTLVRRKNAALRDARREIGAGTQRWDLYWNPVFWLGMASEPVLAAVESRETPVPGASWQLLAGVVVLAAGLGLSAWAMASNPFFEGTVRLQTDRGQVVVEQGPYRFVRHPGYVGLILWAQATPLLLRSTWAWAGALFVVAWVVLRTALEDRFLRAGLAGYEAYTTRTRARLVPGLW